MTTQSVERHAGGGPLAGEYPVVRVRSHSDGTYDWALYIGPEEILDESECLWATSDEAVAEAQRVQAAFAVAPIEVG